MTIEQSSEQPPVMYWRPGQKTETRTYRTINDNPTDPESWINESVVDAAVYSEDRGISR